MGILSSTNVLYFRIAVLFTIAFFCFKDVTSILENSYFMVLTQAMNLPALTLSPQSAQLGLFGIIFIMLAIHDLIPLLERNTKHFDSIVPFRLFCFFILAAVSYISDSNYYLHNNTVFIYSFVEVWMNFIIFNSLREEKNEEFKVNNQFMKDAFDGQDEVEETRDSENENSDEPLTTAEQIEQQIMEEEEISKYAANSKNTTKSKSK